MLTITIDANFRANIIFLQIHWWQFSPREAASLAMKAVLHTGGEGEGSQGKRRHKIVLDLFGQGMLGEIRVHIHASNHA